MPDVIQIAIEAIDHASSVIGVVGTSLDKMGGQVDNADKKMRLFGLSTEQIGAKMTQAGKIATVGLTLPIAGLAVAATKAASDLNETGNKIDTLFGKASDEVKKFADTAATALGQSKKQALDAAADFAVFGKAAGLAGDDLVKFSEKNVTLAADMASFFNTSPEEAITAIGAAFRGESEPIRRYGVLINEASLKDQALRMGLIKTTTEALQPQQRVLAAQALILQQTSAAQGDFAKTSGGLANQSRILNAQFENTIATLGQNLLPIAVKVAGAANDLLKAFNDLEPAQKDLIVAFGLMAAAAGPVLTIGGKLIGVFGSLGSVAIDAAGGVISVGKTVGETAGYLKAAGVSTDTLRFAFQNLKASGAILGAELGVIVAGLIAIGKYLGEVDAASKATTENLLKMANSGDVFKQAAATTEILAHGQDRLNVAVQNVEKQLRSTNKTYDDYAKGVLYAAVAAGTITKAQAEEYISTGKVTDEFYHQTDVTKRVAEQTGILTRADYELAIAQSDVTKGAYGQSGALDESNRAARRSIPITQQATAGLRDYYEATRNANIEGLVRANDQATQSIEVLKIAMQGAVGKEMENFKTKQGELQAKAAELQATISTSYGRARDDAIKSLGDITAELLSNAKTHEEATRRILFDIAAQQLATVQDPQVRAKAMNELALQWDLVDKATYDATENIIAATAKLAADNNVNAFKANLEGIANQQLGVTPINIPVEPKVDVAALKAQPLPDVGLKVTPNIDTDAIKNKKLEPLEVPITVKVKNIAEEAQGVAGDSFRERFKQLPSTVTTKVGVDTTQASKDIQAYTADKVGGIPKEKKTTAIFDTYKATNDTNSLLRLFGLIPSTKQTAVNVDGKIALQTLDDILKGLNDLYSKVVTVTVKYKTEGTPPVGLQHGGSYIVPPNPSGSNRDYFPVLAAAGERVTVTPRADQKAGYNERHGGDTFNYVTNVYNPLAAAMLADKQRRERVARSNSRMGVQ